MTDRDCNSLMHPPFRYTHLGNKNNTIINPYLKREDGSIIPSHEGNGKYEHFCRKSYNINKGLVEAEEIVIVYKDQPNMVKRGYTFC